MLIDAYCQRSSICTCSVTTALVQHPAFIPHNSPHQSVVIPKQHPLQHRQIHRPTDSPHCAIAEYDHAIFKGEKMPSKYKPHCPPIKISPPPNLSIDAYCQRSSICTCSVTTALVQHPAFIPHNSPHQSVVIPKQHPLQHRQIHRPTDHPTARTQTIITQYYLRRKNDPKI